MKTLWMALFGKFFNMAYQAYIDAYGFLWGFDDTLYPEPTDDIIWKYHYDHEFDLVRESVAYSSTGALIATNLPVYEAVV